MKVVQWSFQDPSAGGGPPLTASDPLLLISWPVEGIPWTKRKAQAFGLSHTGGDIITSVMLKQHSGVWAKTLW